MAIPVLIIGKSGSGKSHSLKNLNPEKYGLINVLGKPLPFKNDKRFLKTFSYNEIKRALLSYSKNVEIIVVDDAGYLLTHALMSAPTSKISGSNVFNYYREMAEDFYGLLMFIMNELPDNIIVPFIMHEDKNDFGEIKPKTVGKMLDEKVTIEGLFTVVLHSVKTNDGYRFITNTDGLSVVKSPEGMFENNEINNDMNYVITQIQKYYNIGGEKNE